MSSRHVYEDSDGCQAVLECPPGYSPPPKLSLPYVESIGSGSAEFKYVGPMEKDESVKEDFPKTRWSR